MTKVNLFLRLMHICLFMLLTACGGGGGGGGGGASPDGPRVVGDIMSPAMIISGTPDRTATSFDEMVGSDLAAAGQIDLGDGYTLEAGSLLLKHNGSLLLRAASADIYDGHVLIATGNALQDRFDETITHWEKENGGSTGYSVPVGSETVSGNATVQGVLVMSNLLKYATFGYWAEYWEFEFDNGKSLSEISFEKAFYGGSRTQNAPASGSFTGKALAMAYEYFDDDQYQNNRFVYLFGDASLNVNNAASGTLQLSFADFATLNADLTFSGGAVSGAFTSVNMSGNNSTGIDLTSILAASQPAGKYISNRVEGQFYGLVNATEAAGAFKLQEVYKDKYGGMTNFAKGIQGAFGVKNY